MCLGKIYALRSWSALLLCVLLTACTSLTGNQSRLPDESSPYYLPPLGSQLRLNRDITIAPNSLSVYLQYGKIMASRDIDAYQPNCKFELRDILERPQHVVVDQFEIYRIQRTSEVVLTKPIVVAALRMMSDGDGPMAEIYSTTFYLRSLKQPQVLYLTCQHWDEPGTGFHLNLKQIRQALGDIMTIEIAPNH